MKKLTSYYTENVRLDEGSCMYFKDDQVLYSDSSIPNGDSPLQFQITSLQKFTRFEINETCAKEHAITST